MKNLHIDQLLSAKTAKIPIGENRTVFDAILSTGDPAVLAMITAVEGPSYRPVGAAMALFPQTGSSVGSLSSGCIEGDLMHHAKACAQTGKGRTVRYGIGSPFMDIKLPCGGGLEVTLIPNPPTAELLALTSAIEARRPLKITINADEGTFDKNGGVHICYEPDIHFSVFGSGAEASVFTNLATAAGYSAKLWSPDGADDARLRQGVFPSEAIADEWSAILLFFHDHDWEPELLQAALTTKATYIGAQGSRAARAERDAKLLDMGVPQTDIDRIRGPIGLIPSARDPQTLAVSVLADVLATFKARQ